VKSWRARLEQAAVSARELPAAGAPARAAEEAVKVAPEVEVKRAAAVVAVNDLLNERLGTHKWRREDELEWRRAAIDLSPEQYAEHRYKLINAINANELDASDLDGMR
jgi:hypothetical protein